MLLLLCSILFSFCSVLMSTKSVCDRKNLDTKGQTTPEEVFINLGESLDLECPTTMETSINYTYTYSWFYWIEHNNTWSWCEYPWYKGAFKTIYFNNVTMHLNPPFKQDEGYYTCCVYNEDKTVSVEHQFEVKIIECYQRSTPMTLEETSGNISVEIGGNVTLPPCKAYYGCLNEGEETQRNVYWQYKGTKIENGERFHVTLKKWLQSVIVETSLTIEGLREYDLKYPFDCVVENGKGWSLQLIQKAKDQTETVLEYYWMGVIVGGVAIVALIIIIVFKGWGPQIQFWFRSRFCQNKEPKTVGILHDVGDPLGLTFVKKTVMPQLYEYGFICSLIQDFTPGKTKLTVGCDENLFTCDAVISVLTGVPQDGAFHHFMNDALASKGVVFCILLCKDSSNEKLKETVTLFSQRYKGVTILKWVTKPSKRLITNFWCKVRLKLTEMSKNQEKTKVAFKYKSELSTINCSETFL